MVRKYLIVDIIPLIKLPSKAPDFFSYFSKKKIKEGSIVQVEFRKRKIYGYVAKTYPLEKRRYLLKEKIIELKPILKIINQRPLLLPSQLILAFWLKNYANLSLATALSMFFPYKKLINYQIDQNLLPKNRNNYEILFKKELEKNDFYHKKTLIIVPQENYLKYLASKYEIKNIISSQTLGKKILDLIPKILNKNQETFLSTKNGIFLPWQFLEQIIIYDEGSIFYKEFFKEPYFDYRKIFLKFAEINKIKYLAVSSFPSLSLIKNLNLKPKIKINFQRINFNEFDEKIKEFKKTLIFVPQKTIQKLACEFCYFILNCQICNQPLIFEENNFFCPYCHKKYDLFKTCPRCQKETNFLLLQNSALTIYNYLKKIKENVFFLNKESRKIIKSFNPAETAHLIGSLSLLNPELSAEAFFFFNFSQFYLSADPFLKERFLRILEFFSSRVKNIFLISEILNPEVEEKIKNGEILQDLLKEREINKLPPYRRIVVLKEGLTDLKKLQEKMMAIRKKLENKNLEIIGPIFSRPFKIKKRFFLEIILKFEENLNLNLK